MSSIDSIKLSDFEYTLPEEYIAQFPSERRDGSRLLIYRNGNIAHDRFYNLEHHLPVGTHLMLNNARVIPARLIFKRNTGARIEIFLLEPLAPFGSMESALRAAEPLTWLCMIGNLKKWKDGERLQLELEVSRKSVLLMAELTNRQQQQVTFRWNQPRPFGEILETAGQTPLPPYIKRESRREDSTAYQTVFAKVAGAVAAPTAGLHFTETVRQGLLKKGIQSSEITLFVGAGTFAPVTTVFMKDHPMHAEAIRIGKPAIEALLRAEYLVAVGTTSLRTLESFYWVGAKLLLNMPDPFVIEQLLPYTQKKNLPDWKTALQHLLNLMETTNQNELTANTALMIMPGYSFQSATGLITNFHFPKTTLIMLVAAFIGDDWKKVYDEALNQKYRFLSYGDSSLLWRK